MCCKPSVAKLQKHTVATFATKRCNLANTMFTTLKLLKNNINEYINICNALFKQCET